MAPPSYKDLGKQARDVFSKGYHFDGWKMDCRSKTKSGIQFNTVGHSSQEFGELFGSVEAKYSIDVYGLTLKEKWNTENILFAEVSVQDQLLEGLKLTLEGCFSPETGYKDGRLKVAYGHENVKFDSDIGSSLAGSFINSSVVLGYRGWLAGYQTAFDTQSPQFTKHCFALGLATKDLVLHTAALLQTAQNDAKDWGGSIFLHVSNKLDCGIQVLRTSRLSNTLFGIGATYILDDNTLIRAMIDSTRQIGLGYQQNLSDGITLYLSTLIDASDSNSADHKIGVALEVEV